MSGFAVTAAFQNVEKAGKIGIEIGIRVFQRVTHAGLRGEVDHRTEIAVVKNRLDAFAVGKIEPVKTEFPKLPQDREPGFLERRIVVVIDVVDAEDGAA